MVTLNVNSNDAVVMADKLERLHKSAFPLAVRGALNKAAFNTKQKTLLNTTSKTFTNRNKTFFKANSRVFKAGGWDVKTMVAEVGMTPNRLRSGNEWAIKELEQQEKGGTIGGRSMIPIDEGARIGKSYNRNVRKRYRISDINRVVDAKDSRGKNNKEKFVKASIHAGKGGFVLSADEKVGKRILYEIRGIKRTGNGTKIKFNPIYSYKEGRKVRVKATHFMERSGLISGKHMAKYFNQEGKRQINRLMLK